MQFVIIDYVMIVFALIAAISGLAKGFIRQILGLLGLFLVPLGTFTFHVYPYAWYEAWIPSDEIRFVVALLSTFFALLLIYCIFAKIVRSIARGSDGIGFFDRLLGCVTSVAIVYVLFSVLVALGLNGEHASLSFIHTLLGEHLKESVLVHSIYSNNIIGETIVSFIQSQIS